MGSYLGLLLLPLFMCLAGGLAVAVVGVQKRSPARVGYGAAHLLALTPLGLALAPGGYPAAVVAGEVLVAAHCLGFGVALAAFSGAAEKLWGLVALAAFGGHVFLLANAP